MINIFDLFKLLSQEGRKILFYFHYLKFIIFNQMDLFQRFNLFYYEIINIKELQLSFLTFINVYKRNFMNIYFITTEPLH